MINPAINSDRSWYVIYTRPKCEKKIFSELLKKDVETFLPLYKVIRQWKDRKKKLEIPLFPNYLFVHIQVSDKWIVSKVSGVVRFLQSEGRLSTISEAEVEAIRISLQVEPRISEEKYYLGDKVRICEGPLKGLQGTMLEQKGKKYLLVRIEAVNKNLLVNITENNVQRISPVCS